MSTITVHQLELPENFQEEFLKKVFKIVKMAESGLIIAPAGMGKTLTFGLIGDEKIQNLYLPTTKIVCVKLDLLEDNTETLQTLKQTAENLDPKNRLLILGDNAEILETVAGKTIVQKLKTIREIARPQISIILGSERNILNSEIFTENSSLRSILMENILPLPPLSRSDSKAFASGVAKQLDFKPSAEKLNEIVTQSFGAPRIIKRLIRLACAGEDPKKDTKLTFDIESLKAYKKLNPSYPLEIGEGTTKPQQDTVLGVTFEKTLTKQEYLLTKALLATEGKLVDRESMIKAIWPNNKYETSEHALDQMLHRVKKKLDSATPKCELITLRGRGAKIEF